MACRAVRHNRQIECTASTSQDIIDNINLVIEGTSLSVLQPGCRACQIWLLRGIRVYTLLQCFEPLIPNHAESLLMPDRGRHYHTLHKLQL